MNDNKEVFRDERTVAVEEHSYKWSYYFISYGLLAIIMYRELSVHQQNWDLFGLVIASGLVGTFYQARNHILTRRSVQMMIVTFFVSALVGAGVVLCEMLLRR